MPRSRSRETPLLRAEGRSELMGPTGILTHVSSPDPQPPEGQVMSQAPEVSAWCLLVWAATRLLRGVLTGSCSRAGGSKSSVVPGQWGMYEEPFERA